MKKPKITKWGSILIISLTVLLIVGCVSTMENGLNGKSNELTFESVKMDYFTYSDIDSLVDATPIIVIGKISKDNVTEKININIGEDRYEKPFNLIYTIAELEIEKVIKGDLNVGDTIRIKQAGGSYEGEALKVDDIKYLQKGNSGVFFLASYSNLGIPASLLNPYQGFLEIVDGQAKTTQSELFEQFDLFKNGMAEEKIIDLLVETVIKKDKLEQ